MRNAKEELSNIIENISKVKCAYIWFETFECKHPKNSTKTVVLKLNYSDQDFLEFLGKLDFHYDSGYGIQHIYGKVWLEDGTWMTRGEYDGSEWWEHHKCPDVPEECQ